MIEGQKLMPQVIQFKLAPEVRVKFGLQLEVWKKFFVESRTKLVQSPTVVQIAETSWKLRVDFLGSEHQFG